MAGYNDDGTSYDSGEGDYSGTPGGDYTSYTQPLSSKYPNSILTGSGQYGGESPDSTANWFGFPTWKSFVESVQGPGTWEDLGDGISAYTPIGGLKTMPEYNPATTSEEKLFKSAIMGAFGYGLGGAAGLWDISGAAAGETLGAGMGGTFAGEGSAGLVGAAEGGSVGTGMLSGGGGGLSPEMLEWAQLAGYTPEQISSIGAQFGTDGALLGTGAAAGDFSSVMPQGPNTKLPSSLTPGGGAPNLQDVPFSGGSGGEQTTMQKLKELYGIASPALSIGSGLMNLSNASNARGNLSNVGATADPFGTSGGRGLADTQLQALLRGDVDNDPALKLRIRAAQRAMGSYGQNSGNMAVAAANASTDWYNGRLAQLGQLAGAGFNPASGAQVGIQGVQASNQMQQQALAQIGFGLNSAFGNNGMSPAMMAQLRTLGYAV